MTSLTQESLTALAKDLLAKAEKATPGPPVIAKGAKDIHGRQLWFASGQPRLESQAKRDAEYIAAASPDAIQKLCEAYLRLVEQAESAPK